MKIINTLNIFEASYYLTESGNCLKESTLTKGGFINYCLFCTDEVNKMKDDFAGGLARVHLQTYLFKYKDLYRISKKLEASNQGGAL